MAKGEGGRWRQDWDQGESRRGDISKTQIVLEALRALDQDK